MNPDPPARAAAAPGSAARGASGATPRRRVSAILLQSGASLTHTQ